MKSGLHYEVSQEVFQRFPGYVRGVVLAFGVKNGDSPEDLVEMLREAEASLRDRLDMERLASHPKVVSWREAYKSFGAKPTKSRPSMEAMARRVLKNNPIPSINMLVDIGNIVSLDTLMPSGGHTLDVLESDMELRPATGDEEFIAFGSDKMEHPLPGEIILVEGNTVLTRRWTWRQGRHTLLQPTTTNVEFNVDGLPPADPREVEEACNAIAELIYGLCGGTTRIEMITKDNPRIPLSH
jgi:DNA/RNA-binding domain of Phe-tRNA-synthetase-like protein